MINSLYGNFRTRKFDDIWSDLDIFKEDYETCGIPTTISNDNLTTLYYLLYARYGNSTVASSDENQFKYKVYAIIFQYGPTWEKRLELQQKLRNLTEDELMTGSKMINNHAYNPSTEPSTADLEALPYINEQNQVGQKKGKLDAYGTLMALLDSDVTEEFLSKFKKLFITVVEPNYPLWYISEEEDND